MTCSSTARRPQWRWEIGADRTFGSPHEGVLNGGLTGPMGHTQLGLGQNNLTEEVVLSHARAGCSTPKCSPGRSDARIRMRAGLAAVLMLVGLTGSTALGAPLSGLDDPPSHTSAPRIPQGRTEATDPTAPAMTGNLVGIAQSTGTDAVFVGPPPRPQGLDAADIEPGAESVGAVALASIAYPWQTRLGGWTIVFEAGSGSLRGRTDSETQSIVVFVRPGESAASVARVLAHELGHAVDLTLNSTGTRRQWEAARGIGDEVPWWTTNVAADFATGSGDFAECFATWQVGSSSRSAFGTCSEADVDLVAAMS